MTLVGFGIIEQWYIYHIFARWRRRISQQVLPDEIIYARPIGKGEPGWKEQIYNGSKHWI